MTDCSEVFVGLDTSKLRNAVAIAEAGRNGEVRYFGEIENTEAATRKLVKKLAASKLAHREQRIAFEEMLFAIRQAEERVVRLEQAITAALPDWSLSKVVTALMAVRGLTSTSSGGDFPGRDRRPVALCQPAPIDGVSRPGAG
jgi:hypothetical protein